MSNDIIRDIKLHSFLNNDDHPIKKEFNLIWNDLLIKNTDVYNKDGQEFIYHNSHNDCIFYQDSKNDQFWCSYQKFWRIFQNKFNLGHQEIKTITKYLIEQSLKTNISIPKKTLQWEFCRIEKALKNNVPIPPRGMPIHQKKIENH